MTPEQAFGQVLRELRGQAGLSQEKLAEASDCTRPYVSYLEAGQYSPSLSILFRLAAALRLSATELISRVDQRLAEAEQEVTGT